ncbi:MAG: NUDIX domain-containing protein [Candidatus Aenigmarchaeota archaeon]|nr:NUDIX domain-containing protein [Candidatus Aenigmarchaeota archaeon]
MVVKSRGKILLVKRNFRPEKGYWAVPGGHVEPGETFRQAAQREAVEEVGGVTIEGRQLMSFIHDADIGHRHRAHIFMGKVTGKVVAGSDAAEARWFSLNRMKRMDITHYTKTILNRVRGGKA